MNEAALNIHLEPLLPQAWLIGMALAALMVMVLAAWKNRKSLLLRSITLAALFLALLNPSLIEEQREAVKDVAVIVVDRSPSQKMNGREERTNKALAYLKDNLEKKTDLEVRIVETPAPDTLVSETLLFEALESSVADVPLQRRAGVIFITDGQIHDIPADSALHQQFGPVHALLSGHKNEKDRQVVIVEAPTYGIVGQTISIKFKIEDTSNIAQDAVPVTLTSSSAPPDEIIVTTGSEETVEFPVTHAGQNVFEISTDSVDGEITDSNNRAAVIVNGVRDRLRVLLVSGQPYAGGRTWRDLLTSDPGVDLIHFTILRDPNKLDATPQNELSLIAFPVPELFEVKLYDFDLIIFDRYHLNRILPERYFNNIARYVEEGGALLEASGPSFATEDSIYFTGLMNVLPGIPTGEVIRKPFQPAITDNGMHHPVTHNLLWPTAADGSPGWGHWLRQVALNPDKGDVLMSGAGENPLLILDRVGNGRVAQLASDHIWLWARGYEGGGPHAELLRRVVHWLMKEPELDEKALDIKINGNKITLKSRNYKDPQMTVSFTKPDETSGEIVLQRVGDGPLEAVLTADQIGIYSFDDADGQKRFAVVGDLNPPELRSVRTTPDLLRPVMDASRGSAVWLNETPHPDIRYIAAGNGSFAGRNWLALRKNNDFVVTGVQDRPLLPPWAAVLLIIGLATLCWWREGRGS